MIAIAAFMVSCTGTSIGREPVIDEENGTIDGKKYDKETMACWEFTYEYTETCTDGEEGESEKGSTLMWNTEFGVYSYKAEFDYAHNWSAYVYGHGCKCSGTSSVRKVEGRTDETCYDTYGK